MYYKPNDSFYAGHRQTGSRETAMYYKTYYNSPVGLITIAGDGAYLAGLWIEGQKYFPGTVKEEMAVRNDLPLFGSVRSWLDRYFAGERPDAFELPLTLSGSKFRQEVWKLLCEIPYGETATYGEIAKKVAEKLGRSSMSAQAVGGAVGHNPISIIIPCHRVIGADGSLTGYAGGLDKKVWLLEHEGVRVKYK